MKDREIHYTSCLIICHGKSEKELFGTIKQNLRLKITIDAEKNGTKSIQINSLNRFLNNHKYENRENFLNYFSDIKTIRGKPDSSFKIFTVMDTDDKEKVVNLKRYLNKEMFKRHHLYDYIVPIYNTPKLEDVFEEIGHKFKNKGEARKKEYRYLLEHYHTPTLVRNYLNDLEEKFKKCKNTNLEEVFNFILNIDKQ